MEHLVVSLHAAMDDSRNALEHLEDFHHDSVCLLFAVRILRKPHADVLRLKVRDSWDNLDDIFPSRTLSR